MSVSNYTPGNGCSYSYSKLRDRIYLVSEDHVKKIYIDSGEAYISGLTETPLVIEGFNIDFKEESSLDERYKFQKTLTISKKGYASFKDFQGKYYAIIETIDGTFYMINVDFPSKITHVFNLSKDTNQTDFTFTSLSNYPTLKINYDFGSVPYVCKGFNVSGIKGLKLCERIRTEISTVNDTIYTYGDSTGVDERSFRTIEYLGESCTFQEAYDGDKVTDTITFDIGFDAYKTSWQYNLLEFVENLYSAIIESKGEEDIRYYSGFNHGLEPSYSIAANNGDKQSDIITITLVEASNSGLFRVDEMTVTNDNSKSWRYIRKYGNHNTYECLEPGVGLYLVKEEVWANGTPTGRYMVMDGYEDEFYYLNIVGTFDDEVTFYQPECNCVSRPLYEWQALPIGEEYECDTAATKYYKEAQVVSYDCGESWEETGQYRRGDVYEYNSADCGYAEMWQRLAISEDYWCDDCPEQPTPETTYLTFEAQESGTFTFSGTSNSNVTNRIYYSLDSGATWSSPSNYVTTPTIESGSTVMWKGELTPIIASPYDGVGTFSSTGLFKAYGNTMSIVYGDNYREQTSLSGKNNMFNSLFIGCTGLTNIEDMVLPATTLAKQCYLNMFYGCTSLASIPSDLLPARTLTETCYGGMFYGCTSLASVPNLPAIALADRCYLAMFEGCTSLANVPSNLLPALVMKKYCYSGMFRRCSSLTSVPNLPATTLDDYCYQTMFEDCISLANVPSNLLPATTLKYECYGGMFDGCASLAIAPELPAITLAERCYITMFVNCNNLRYIKCLATNGINSNYSTFMWATAVAPLGTFVKNANTSWPVGIDGIPSGWTVYENTTGTMYREINSTAYCNGNDLYKDVYSQVSFDSGNTWVTTATTPTLVEPNSEDCGYVPPTPSGGTKWVATYNDSHTISRECDSTLTIAEGEITLTDLVSVQIGDCITSIGNYAFSGCTSLTGITIPSGVTSIGGGAFASCSGLTSVVIPDRVTNIGNGAFVRCDSLTSITLSNSVTTISNEIFSGCISLTNITIPNSVTSIGIRAFQTCTELTNIVIGDGVTSIGNWAFSYCRNLQSLTISSLTPPNFNQSYNPFQNTNDTFIIYVPLVAVDRYKTATGWSSFASRIQAIS